MSANDQRFFVDWPGFAESDFVVVDRQTGYVERRFSPHWSGTADARQAAVRESERLNQMVADYPREIAKGIVELRPGEFRCNI
jgi:hypothetical protein